jgi:CO/xanthine dehydrogenase FAD-binding subunit
LVLVLLGGSVLVEGPAGRREIAADEFFRFHLTTTRRRDEIAVEARFPVLRADNGWAFDEVTRRHGDYAIAGVGAVVRMNADGRLSEIRLAACGVTSRPIRLPQAEKLLNGTALSEADLKAAGRAAAEAVTAPDDMHASNAYRRRAVATLVRRMAAKAATRARERIGR